MLALAHFDRNDRSNFFEELLNLLFLDLGRNVFDEKIGLKGASDVALDRGVIGSSDFILALGDVLVNDKV